MAAMFIFMVLSFEKWRIQLPNPNLLLIDSCPSFNFTFFHHLPANPGQTMRCWRLLRSSPLGTSVPAWLQPTILVAAFNPLRFFWWKHGQHACPWVTFFWWKHGQHACPWNHLILMHCVDFINVDFFVESLKGQQQQMDQTITVRQ